MNLPPRPFFRLSLSLTLSLTLSLITILAVTLLVPAGPASARPDDVPHVATAVSTTDHARTRSDPPAAARSANGTYVATAVSTTNQARDRNDLRKLTHSDCLQRLALRQAKKMARQKRLFHQDLRGVQRECGMGWAGENVAVGYTNGRAVVRAWMRSPGHRANILQRHFRMVGIAAVKSKGNWWAAQVFGTRA